MQPDLTVLVPAFNEEANLRDCLESVSWAPKILIVDSGSTDCTIEIANDFNVEIVTHEYVNSATQKNWALDRIKSEWVFIIDCDERVSEPLRDEILGVLKSPKNDGYRIRRVNHFLGRQIQHCGWQKDYVLRLFKTKSGRYQDRAVHAEVELSGKTDTLDGTLTHFPYRSISDSFRKLQRYSKWSAEDLAAKGVKPSRSRMMLKPAGRFLRQYVLERGFLDGIPGLILCGFSAMGVFTKYARLWESNGHSKPGGCS